MSRPDSQLDAALAAVKANATSAAFEAFELYTAALALPVSNTAIQTQRVLTAGGASANVSSIGRTLRTAARHLSDVEASLGRTSGPLAESIGQATERLNLALGV
jgi:hypothetical protein